MMIDELPPDPGFGYNPDNLSCEVKPECSHKRADMVMRLSRDSRHILCCCDCVYWSNIQYYDATILTEETFSNYLTESVMLS